MVVPDEFGKGYPVGHLISNKEDKDSLPCFFNAIKERCVEDFKIGALMTDDDNVGFSAFSEVFGDKFPHFLCKWHIHRTWRRRLQNFLPHDRDLQIEMYQALLILMNEKKCE